MHFYGYVALLSTIAASAVGHVATGPLSDTHVVHEKRNGETRWVRGPTVASHVKLPVRIGLKQNVEALSKAPQWLMDVSHPLSEKYGQHWTQEQVIEAFRPASESIDAVSRWVQEELGIARNQLTNSDNKGWIAFDATTAQLEKLVHAKFHHHEAGDGRVMISCDQYRIPKHLQRHIDFVTPGVRGIYVSKAELSKRSQVKRTGRHAPRNGRRGRQSPMWRPIAYNPAHNSSLDTCDKAITPECLQALYQFKALSPTAQVNPSNALGIFEEGDTYAQQDLDMFYANFTPYIPKGTHPKLDSIDGGKAPIGNLSNAGGESDLDFQLAIPIIYPQTTTLYQTDDDYWSNVSGGTGVGLFNTFLDAIDGSYCTYSAYGETGNDPIDPVYPDAQDPSGYQGPLQCGVYKPTNVISISYGEQEQDLPAYYQERQCNEWLKLGLQGVSVFVASGDTGVGGLPGDGSPNGCLRNGTVFSPTHPNSCPWLTNVGATKVYPGKTVRDPESAVNDPPGHPYRGAFSSSGGFSNIFPIPDYQTDAVANYFKNHNPPYPYYTNGKYNGTNGLYNRNGRGIPDVAANGDNIVTYVAGKYGLHGGTSASSPIFAALLTRINEERLKIGKKSVGFINPTLYQHPEVLNDVVNGTNPGCGTEGFSSVPGWDPVTGLGTPNYPRMLSLFLSLP